MADSPVATVGGEPVGGEPGAVVGFGAPIVVSAVDDVVVLLPEIRDMFPGSTDTCDRVVGATTLNAESFIAVAAPALIRGVGVQ